MSTHLTLVCDNSRVRDASADASAGPPDDDGSETPELIHPHWVHAAWAPAAARLRRRARVRGVEHSIGRGVLRSRLRSRLRRRARRVAQLTAGDRGAVTAEYAIVIMAAVAFAGLLVAIMRSSEIRAMLVDLVQNALGTAG